MRERSEYQGRVMRDLIAHVTNDHLIGKKIKNGELRKKSGIRSRRGNVRTVFH